MDWSKFETVRYTNIVLTVIALLLAALAGNSLFGKTTVKGGVYAYGIDTCGRRGDACHVYVVER